MKPLPIILKIQGTMIVIVGINISYASSTGNEVQTVSTLMYLNNQDPNLNIN